MKKILLFLSFLLTMALNAQSEGHKRIEFNLKDDFKNYNVCQFGDKGLVVLSESKKSKKGKRQLRSQFYDKDLNLVSEFTDARVPRGGKVFQSFIKDNVSYSLVRHHKFMKNFFSIIIADNNTHKTRVVNGEFSRKKAMISMKASGDKAVFRVAGKKHDIIIVDLKSGVVKEASLKIDGIRRNNLIVKSFDIVDNDIFVFLATYKNRNTNYYICKLDLEGHQQELYPVDMKIDAGVDFNILSTKIKKDGNKYIMSGNFSIKRVFTPQGVFIAEIENKKLNYFKPYSFLDINNFTSYMNKSQQKGISRKQKRLENKGKGLLMSHNMRNRPLQKNQVGYQFVGECYIDVYGMTKSENPFRGYLYTHGIVIQFDKKGNVLWSNTFPIYANKKGLTMTLPRHLIQIVDVKNEEDKVKLVFGGVHNVNLTTLNAQTGELENQQTKNIHTLNKGDELKRRSVEEIVKSRHWYRDTYLNYGKQKIIGNERRMVFFIEKQLIK